MKTLVTIVALLVFTVLLEDSANAGWRRCCRGGRYGGYGYYGRSYGWSNGYAGNGVVYSSYGANQSACNGCGQQIGTAAVGQQGPQSVTTGYPPIEASGATPPDSTYAPGTSPANPSQAAPQPAPQTYQQPPAQPVR